MCGICGIISGTLSHSEETAFENLLYVSQLRGADSTGVFAVAPPREKQRLIAFKEPFEASTFLQTGDKHNIKDKILKFGHRAMIGHCRAATIGKIKTANAHPFSFPNVIGVHNGTIRKKFKFTGMYETDSEALIRNLNDSPVQDVVDEIEGFDTAYALVWYHKQDDKLHFLRNEKRPLWFGYDSGGTVLLVASEKEMIEFAARRNNITLKDDNPWQLKANTLFTLNLGVEFGSDILKNPEITEVKPKKVYGGYYYVPFRGGAWSGLEDLSDEDWANYAEYGTPTGDEPKKSKQDEDLPAVDETPEDKPKSSKLFFHGFKGVQIAAHLWRQYCKHGCQMCGEIIDPDEPGIDTKIGWANIDQLICETCIDDPWVKRYMVAYKASDKVSKTKH